MDQGWSVKELIRQIVLSRAYQLASTHDAKNFEVDPDNTLVWRMSKKRLEAEAIRDAVLAASGRLIVEPPVGSAVAQAGEGLAGPYRGFNQDGQDLHRAVYLPVVRDQLPDSLALFDFRRPEPGHRRACHDQRPVAGALPDEQPVRHPPGRGRRRAVANIGEKRRQPRDQAAYLRFLSRNPTAAETARARDFLAQFPAPRRRRRPRAGRLDGFLPGTLRERRVPLPRLTEPPATKIDTDRSIVLCIHHSSLISRRALLKTLSSGFGYVAFAGLSSFGRLAVRLDRQRLAAGAQAAALPGEGEAGDLPVHARGAVARRHVRLQAPARGRYRQALAGRPAARAPSCWARPGLSASTARAASGSRSCFPKSPPTPTSSA